MAPTVMNPTQGLFSRITESLGKTNWWDEVRGPLGVGLAGLARDPRLQPMMIEQLARQRDEEMKRKRKEQASAAVGKVIGMVSDAIAAGDTPKARLIIQQAQAIPGVGDSPEFTGTLTKLGLELAGSERQEVERKALAAQLESSLPFASAALKSGTAKTLTEALTYQEKVTKLLGDDWELSADANGNRIAVSKRDPTKAMYVPGLDPKVTVLEKVPMWVKPGGKGEIEFGSAISAGKELAPFDKGILERLAASPEVGDLGEFQKRVVAGDPSAKVIVGKVLRERIREGAFTKEADGLASSLFDGRLYHELLPAQQQAVQDQLVARAERVARAQGAGGAEGRYSQELKEMIGPEATKFIDRLTLKPPEPNTPRGMVYGSGRYASVPAQFQQDIGRAMTALEQLNAWEKVIRKRDDWFPASSGDSSRDLLRVGAARLKMLAQAPVDPDYAPANAIQGNLAGFRRLEGDTANAAIMEQSWTALALALKGTTKEQALANIQLMRDLASNTVSRYADRWAEEQGLGAKVSPKEHLVSPGGVVFPKSITLPRKP